MKRKNSRQRTAPNQGYKPLFETIEPRMLLSASPTGLTPIEVRDAYGFSQINFTNTSGQTITGDGAGQTIAIVDPYNAKTIASDLDTFDQTFDFDSSGQTLYQEFGAASSFLSIDSLGKGATGAGWALEVALDVEWAHAIAPAAQIDLVEAASASTNALLAAVKTAADLPGVSVVSMSWGGSEARNESTFDSTFTTPAGHTGVTFVAAAGDDGAVAEWPAVSPNVLAVGGTTLNVSSNGTYVSESAWSDSGGGYSGVETEPGYQDAVNASGLRSTPDVSYDANPNSGFSVYTSVKQGNQSGWFTVGGTSAGAPQWSALIAIADQGRADAGESTLDGPTQTLPYLYEMPESSFHDITTGSNGYRATTGYDLATGLGSPIANLVVSNLITPTTSTGSGSSGSGSSGSGTGSGGGFGSGTSHGFPPPPSHFHIGHFPNRFHRWDMTDAPLTATATFVSNQPSTPHVYQSAARAIGNNDPIQFASTANSSAGIFGFTPIESTFATPGDLAAQTFAVAFIPSDFAGQSALTTMTSTDLTGTFATISPTPFSNQSHETLQAIFSTQSIASSVAAMISRGATAIAEDGLETTLLVLPLIAFWAYQSRLSKSRGIHSLHWISLD